MTNRREHPERSGRGALLSGVRHVALDMDGTVYRGGTVFPETLPFLHRLGEMGLTYSFLTNNSSRSVASYASHLAEMGIPATPDRIYTSGVAAAAYLRARHPAARRVYLVGTPSFAAELESDGFELATDDPEDEPDAVVIAYDPEVSLPRLGRAAWWIARGCLYVATHPDLVCPTDEETVRIDCGAVCAAIRAVTGRDPDAVTGKPSAAMLEGLCGRLSLHPPELVMVGDRLYTDMEMARRAGVPGVLVLTGEATAEEAARRQPPPDLVVRNLRELGDHIAAAREGA